MLTKQVLYNGRDEPSPVRISLRAGPWEMLFEEGDWRTVRLEGREILRRVYVAVRDRNWGTVPARLSNQSVRVEENSFEVDYDVDNQSGEIDFTWHGRLRGTADGRITFAMEGMARSTFEKNRIGFCVLFPAGNAGQPVRIEHGDGTRVETVFPVDIRADQPVRPFEQIGAMILPLGERGEVILRFEGDVFEMEDQRLWTDASYKVFCTPLALPYPVQIQAGTRVSQAIELGLLPALAGMEKKQPAAGPGQPRPFTICLPSDSVWKALPRLGLVQASHGQPLSQGEIERLKALRLHHLRVDLPLADAGYPQRLARAVVEASAMGVGLETALLVSAQNAEAELADLRVRLEALQPKVTGWLVYPSQELFAGGSPIEAVLRAARRRLQDYRPGIPFAAGTNTDFVFLKRSPLPFADLERVCIALNPQVHAFDDLSLVETLEAQPMVVESARRLAGGLPVVVSPITLKPRFNPYAAGPLPETPPGMLPPQVDPRQRSLFGAGWTLGSLGAMVAGGAASVTYFETSGWRGVMEREGGSPWPDNYPSLAGCVFPLYHVLADAGDFQGGQAAVMLNRDGADDRRVSAVALRLDGQVTILMANHTLKAQPVRIEGLEGDWRVRTLDETNAEFAMRSPGDYRSMPSEIIRSADLIISPLGYMRMDCLKKG